jgi:hypothetical protein
VNDAAAYALAKPLLLGSCSEAEIQFLLSVGRLESGYGDNWKPGEGKGSNNWFAIQEPNFATRAHFDHVDTHADGSKYVAHFKVYPAPQLSILDGRQTVLKPNVRAALAAGDGNAAVAAMRANGYFEAPLSKYQSAMRAQHAAFIKATGLEPAVKFEGSDAGLLLLLVAAAWSFFS